MAQVLIVEDEPDIARALEFVLRNDGHECTVVGEGVAALRTLHEQHPDLVVLDIGLPVMSGWEVLDRIRQITEIPVLMLTAAGSDEDKVRGLRSGADDYLTKPFSNTELVARIGALLRRSRDVTWEPNEIVYGSVVVSEIAQTVTVDSHLVTLSPQEFRMLLYFLRHRGQVLSTAQILDEIWDDPSGDGGDRVKFAVLRLRRKLGWADTSSTPLVAVRGIGYRLETDPPPS